MTPGTTPPAMAEGGAPTPTGPSPVERRLATILIADVFDYSRSMEEDEERTVRTLRGHRALFEKLLGAHRGRIFNTAGDAMLAEFPSPAAAVRCATDTQAALRARNDQLPAEQRLWFRIGINLGDVIVQGGDLLGDGVNVAARIQAIAEPGGVCISGSIYDQIRDRLTLPIRPLGEQEFKNIAQPVRTFAISVDDRAPRSLAMRWRAARMGPRVAAAGLAAGLIALGATGFWLHYVSGLPVPADAKRAEDSNRAPDLQPGGRLDAAAVAQARKEAVLLAELEAAKDALAKAEADAKKGGSARSGGDAAQRQAKLEDELKAAREALKTTAQRGKKAGAAEDAPDAARPAAEPVVAGQLAAIAPPAAAASAAADRKSADSYDGVYAGEMCSPNVDNTTRCWDVVLKAEHGALSAAWPSPWSTQLARASGTISDEGRVELALAGFNARNGRPFPGKMTGRWAAKTITAAGTWANESPVSAKWTWAPSASPLADNEQPTGTDKTTADNPDEAPARQRGSGRHRRW